RDTPRGQCIASWRLHAPRRKPQFVNRRLHTPPAPVGVNHQKLGVQYEDFAMSLHGSRCAWFFAMGLVVFVGLPLGAQQDSGKEPGHRFLWKATSKTTTIYLLGSLHVVTKDIFPLPKEIEDAFADSKKLVVEVNAVGLDQQKLLEMTVKKGTYPKGETLSK